MSIVAWKVNSYDRTPTRKEFVRETNAFYIGVDRYGKERKEKKESSWWRYFTDEQEAIAFISARDTAKEKRAREDRAERLLLAAAPDLLRELEHLVMLLEPLEQNGGLNVPGLATLNAARNAIAKATGGQ
jgi:hypothetical protein